MNYKRLKMEACWLGDWETSFTPRGTRIIKFIIKDKHFDKVYDIVKSVEDHSNIDIQDVAEMRFSHESNHNWVLMFIGNMEGFFATVHVYGQRNTPTSFEIYDIDGDEIDYGEL